MGDPADGGRRALRVGMVVCSEYESDARVRRQAEALVARGDEVTVFALHAHQRPRVEKIDGVRVVHASTAKYRGDSARSYLSLYGGFAAGAAAWLARRPRAFDVVQAHSIPEALAFTAALQRAARVPVVLDVHDLAEQLFASKFRPDGLLIAAVRASARAALAFATEVLTVHEPYAETLRGMTRRPVTVVMNCADERRFRRRPFRSWEPGGEIVFGYHGLIAPRHGLHHAIEALRRLHHAMPQARLTLLGGGDGLAALRAQTSEHNLEEAVRLPDAPVPLDEVPARLADIHIGLVPSQLDPWTSEVLPTKLLEYAAAGIPVITFRNHVIERYFPPDAVTYVDPATPENLHAAMRIVASDPERARRQVEAASAVLTGLTWQRQRETYFAVLDRVTGRRVPQIPRQLRREPMRVPDGP